jgi:Ser/Thr protein kinase RdoA (MazF antagonist)
VNALPTLLPESLLPQLPEWLDVASAVALGNHGGFSGANLWRVPGQRLTCIRCWPPGSNSTRIRQVHELLKRLQRAGIDYVPLPYPLRDGSTIAVASGRNWDLSPWLEGTADFQTQPSSARLVAAVQAVAKIHLAWQVEREARSLGTVPAVQRRWQRILSLQSGKLTQIQHAVHQAHLRTATQTSREEIEMELLELAGQIVPEVEARLPYLARQLESILTIQAPLQFCLRDIWHDHVLFRGDAVSGIVDFDALDVDCVATDLARLLGSLVQDDDSQWRLAIAAYEEIAPLTETEHLLIPRIDQANVVLNAVQWLEWLYIEGRSFDDRHRVRGRLQHLAGRLAHGKISDAPFLFR